MRRMPSALRFPCTGGWAALIIMHEVLSRWIPGCHPSRILYALTMQAVIHIKRKCFQELNLQTGETDIETTAMHTSNACTHQ